MFLKHISIQVQDDCPIHGEAVHTFEFIKYDALKHIVIIRLLCHSCDQAEISEWEYYQVSPQYWTDFLYSHRNNDFTGAS